MTSERQNLISVIESCYREWLSWKVGQTLLTEHNTRLSLWSPIADAVEHLAGFQAVRGLSILSGGGALSLEAEYLKGEIVDRLYFGHRAIPDVADWLLRVLHTKFAPGRYIAAVWGLSTPGEVQIMNDTTLVPFDSLPESEMTKTLQRRAGKVWNGEYLWSQGHYDLPSSALIHHAPNFPYVGSAQVSFMALSQIQEEMRIPITFVQAALAGQPLAIGGWFEYDDPALDLNANWNFISWVLPEVHPEVKKNATIDPKTAKHRAIDFQRLPRDWRERLLRCMERFILSQCRHQLLDRALDLALAFEIAVSSQGDNAPANWKVGVRSAQLLGGDIATRQANRATLGAMYQLRSIGIHGGSLKSQQAKHLETLSSSAAIFRKLLARLIDLGTSPDWTAIELEAPKFEVNME